MSLNIGFVLYCDDYYEESAGKWFNACLSVICGPTVSLSSQL